MANNESPYKQKKVLTQKQALKEPVGSFYHPTEKTVRTGACPEGYNLKRGYEREGYVKKNGTKVEPSYINATCVKNRGFPGKSIKKYQPKHLNDHTKILTEKQAKKKPVGTFYHPTEETYRTGACPEGFELRKGYERKAYTKKDGTLINKTYVGPTCIKDKGLPGKRIEEFKPIKLNKKTSLEPYGYNTKLNGDSRFNSLLKAVSELSYATVVHRLNAINNLIKRIDPVHSKIYEEDLRRLKEWRLENPDLYKKNNMNKINLVSNYSKNNIISNNKIYYGGTIDNELGYNFDNLGKETITKDEFLKLHNILEIISEINISSIFEKYNIKNTINKDQYIKIFKDLRDTLINKSMRQNFNSIKDKDNEDNKVNVNKLKIFIKELENMGMGLIGMEYFQKNNKINELIKKYKGNSNKINYPIFKKIMLEVSNN